MLLKASEVKEKVLQIDILSLFPSYFQGPFDESILKRAREQGLINLNLIDIRHFATGKHRRVDDRPFGGGPGMVLMPEPLTKAIQSVKTSRSKVIYLSPQGKQLTAEKSRELAQNDHLILICGHYEGIDERVSFDEEISIGDYVLTNGCLSAIVLVDSVARFVPGVLGHSEAAEKDSFQSTIFDCPHYTKPANFQDCTVPTVLQGGNHQEISAWRHERALFKTKKVRPDLFISYLQKLKEAENLCGQIEGQKRPLSFYLFVNSLKKSLRFYQTQVRLQLISEGHESLTFAFGDASCGFCLHLIEVKEVEESASRSPALIEVNMPPELFVRFKGHLNRKVYSEKGEKQLFVVDPDGHLWNFVSDSGFLVSLERGLQDAAEGNVSKLDFSTLPDIDEDE